MHQRVSSPWVCFFLLLYFFNYTNESFKGSMPANDDFKSDCGREGRWEWGGGLEIHRVSSSGVYFFIETTLHDYHHQTPHDDGQPP